MYKIISLLLITINLLFAHPHTFIEVYPTITIKDNIIQNIRFKWQLDEIYTIGVFIFSNHHHKTNCFLKQ